MSRYSHQPPHPPSSPPPPPPPSPTPPYPHYDPPPYAPVPPPSSPSQVAVPPSSPPYLPPPSYPPSPTPSYHDPPPPPTPYYDPPPPPYDSYGNTTGHTPSSPPGYWHGGHIAMVVLVPIAGLCLLGLLAGLFLLARRRRRVPEPECPPEEVQEVSEYVRVHEQVVAEPAGEVVLVDVLDEVVVQQEHGVVRRAHGRGKGPY